MADFFSTVSCIFFILFSITHWTRMWWKWGPSFATELGWEPFLRNRFETVFKSRDGGRLDSLLWLCPISARKEIICQDKHFFKRNRTSKRNSLVTVVPSNFFFLFSFCQIRICPTEERTGREKKGKGGRRIHLQGCNEALDLHGFVYGSMF